MTDFTHVGYSMGYTIASEDAAPIVIKGKRRWYAPWLRYPDRVFDPIEQLEATQRAFEKRLRDDIDRRLFGTLTQK